jgi:hypothetical protein
VQAAAHQERSQYIHALVRRFAERFVAPLQRAVKPCC